jgi:hypothetical protein
VKLLIHLAAKLIASHHRKTLGREDEGRAFHCDCIVRNTSVKINKPRFKSPRGSAGTGSVGVEMEFSVEATRNDEGISEKT